MIAINPKQVEWIWKYRPDIVINSSATAYDATNPENEGIWVHKISTQDYNSLPQTFKDLADGIPKD
jgi:hypothetical protein